MKSQCLKTVESTLAYSITADSYSACLQGMLLTVSKLAVLRRQARELRV
jgi:hypothetical protein